MFIRVQVVICLIPAIGGIMDSYVHFVWGSRPIVGFLKSVQLIASVSC